MKFMTTTTSMKKKYTFLRKDANNVYLCLLFKHNLRRNKRSKSIWENETEIWEEEKQPIHLHAGRVGRVSFTALGRLNNSVNCILDKLDAEITEIVVSFTKLLKCLTYE